MTVQRLSAYSVKVQLSAEELRVFMPDEPRTPDSPQMLRMLSFMLAKAESVSGIAFSALPVTVEVISAQDGSLAVYFSVAEESKLPAPEQHQRVIRIAARFTDSALLRQCCTLLEKEQPNSRSSVLYRYQTVWILTLKLRRLHASLIRHILLEYGKPFRLSAMNRARLSEYGVCIFNQDAVHQTAASESFPEGGS